MSATGSYGSSRRLQRLDLGVEQSENHQTRRDIVDVTAALELTFLNSGIKPTLVEMYQFHP